MICAKKFVSAYFLQIDKLIFGVFFPRGSRIFWFCFWVSKWFENLLVLFLGDVGQFLGVAKLDPLHSTLLQLHIE